MSERRHRGGRPGGPGTRGGPRPRVTCPACGRGVGTTEAGRIVWHNPPGRTFPSCEGAGRDPQEDQPQ